MRREVAGTLIFYKEQQSIREVVQIIQDIWSRLLPSIPITHFCGGTMIDARYRKWVKHDHNAFLDDAETRAVDLASFSDAESAKNGIDWKFHISVSDTESRGPRCFVIGIGFAEQLVRDDCSLMLSVTDALAKEFSIQSGHLHDLSDFSDQNQMGPHWFKITGRPLDPKKIKYSEVLKEDIIDIELNPCHVHVVGAVDYTSAWTVYLGAELLSAIPEGVLNKLNAEIVRLGISLVRVTLFSDPFKSQDRENVEKLWDFRRKLNIDEVAHRSASIY